MKTIPSSKLAAVAVALTALSACNSLQNPDRTALEVGIAADGTTALYFYDGVGIGDPALNVARFMPYPEPMVSCRTTARGSEPSDVPWSAVPTRRRYGNCAAWAGC